MSRMRGEPAPSHYTPIFPVVGAPPLPSHPFGPEMLAPTSPDGVDCSPLPSPAYRGFDMHLPGHPLPGHPLRAFESPIVPPIQPAPQYMYPDMSTPVISPRQDAPGLVSDGGIAYSNGGFYYGDRGVPCHSRCVPLQHEGAMGCAFKCPELKEMLVDLRKHLDEHFQRQKRMLELLLKSPLDKRSSSREPASKDEAVEELPLKLNTVVGPTTSDTEISDRWAHQPAAVDESASAGTAGKLVPEVVDVESTTPHAEVTSSVEAAQAASETSGGQRERSRGDDTQSKDSEGPAAAARIRPSQKPKGRSPERILYDDDEEWLDGQTRWTVFQRKVNRIVTHPYFDYGAGLAIVLNTILLGVQTDVNARRLSENPETQEPVFFSAVETIFAIVFLSEAILRLVAFQAGFFWDPWNWMDVVIVLGAIVEEVIKYGIDNNGPGQLAMIRLLKAAKILRSVRVLRVFRAFRELRSVLRSIGRCLKSLFWVCCMLFTLIYFATLLILLELTSKEDPYSGSAEALVRRKYFNTFLRALFSMYQATTGGIDWELLCAALEDIMPWVSIVWLVYVGTVVFTITNTVTGIFVDQAMSSASDDFRNTALEESDIRDIKLATLRQLFLQAVDPPGCGYVSRPAMLELCSSESAAKVFNLFNIDPRDVFAFFELVSCQQDCIKTRDIDQFVLSTFRLRGFGTAMGVAACHYGSRIAN